jgi:DNA polymerase-3 subunit alpha
MLGGLSQDEMYEHPTWLEACKKEPRLPRLFEFMIDKVKGLGQHAGGIVLLPDGLLLPIESTADKKGLQIAFDKKDVEEAGGVKFDFLGVKNMALIALCEKLTGVETPHPLDIQKDDPMWEQFANGQTSGVFQLSTPTAIELCKNVKPTTVDELAEISALNRPSALGSGLASEYHILKSKPRKFGHALVDDILETTGGIILFEEQMMSIVQAFTGGDFSDADMARRLVTKFYNFKGEKKGEAVKQIEELRNRFVEGAFAQGVSRSISMAVWEDIQNYVRYGFNKSHATAYAYNSTVNAWYRYYHPVEFFTACMNIDDKVNAVQYIFDAINMGVEVKPPNILNPSDSWTTDGSTIFAPLTSVKFLSEKAVEDIMENAPFENKKDFNDRTTTRLTNKRVKKSLFMVGALSDLEGDYSDLGLKDKDFEDCRFEIGSFKARQMFMNEVIPTKNVVKWIQEYSGVAGIVTKVKKKKSDYGAYRSYLTTPHTDMGVWMRETDGLLEVGDCVRLNLKKDNNKILSFEHYGD